MSLLVDTNVLSELRKPLGKQNIGVTEWAAAVVPGDVYLSVVTVAELSEWVARTKRRDQVQGQLLERWFQNQVLLTYSSRILPLDTDIAIRVGALHVPDRRDYRDAFIAATALQHDLTVVTRNVPYFAPTGVKIVNPFR
jgi:predicted nucleic acid-binding protein